MVWSFFEIKQCEKVNILEIKIGSFELHLQLKKRTNNFKSISSPIGPIAFHSSCFLTLRRRSPQYWALEHPTLENY
jgi:hypothetical protein